MAGEIVKARKNLKELREDIIVAAHELGIIQDQVTPLRSEKVALENEITRLRRTITSLLGDIAARLEELRRLGVNIEDKHDVASRLGTVLSDVETKWKELEDRFGARTTSLNRLDDSILEKERLLSERQTAYDSLGKELDTILSEKSEAETARDKAYSGIEKANELHRQIAMTIHAAMEKFRIFERRIARFSKDTGYVVGYPRPEKLLDSELAHESGIQ